MALIPCPECQREISTLAPACPHCGTPLRPPAPPQSPSPINVGGAVPSGDRLEPGQRIAPDSRHVQTIEQTGKKWKGAQLLGCLTQLFGVALILSGASTSTDTGVIMAAIGILVIFFGAIMVISARIGAWWHHG